MKLTSKTDIWTKTDPQTWRENYNNVWDIGLLFIGANLLAEIFLPYRQNILILIWNVIFILLFILKTISYRKYQKEAH